MFFAPSGRRMYGARRAVQISVLHQMRNDQENHDHDQLGRRMVSTAG